MATEQLDKAAASVEAVNTNLNTADWLLRGMESYTGMLWNYMSSPPPPVSASLSIVMVSQLRYQESASSGSAQNSLDDWVLVQDDARPPTKKAPHPPKTEFDKQLQMEEDLQGIDKVASELKALTIQTRKELVHPAQRPEYLEKEY